ncbi:hypothetical protein B1B_06855, partial [mine drainage metagenome]
MLTIAKQAREGDLTGNRERYRVVGHGDSGQFPYARIRPTDRQYATLQERVGEERHCLRHHVAHGVAHSSRDARGNVVAGHVLNLVTSATRRRTPLSPAAPSYAREVVQRGSRVTVEFQGRIGRDWRDSTPWWPPTPTPPPHAPNVMMVVLDDVGFAQLGCYGSTITTPVIDALAA